MTVEELGARMTAREFAAWQVYDAMEGLPVTRAEWQRATLLALTANVHRKKGARAYTSADFVPGLRPAPAARPVATKTPGQGLGFFLGYLDAKAR